MKYISFIILSLLLLSCNQDKKTSEEKQEPTTPVQSEDQLTLSDEQLKAIDLQYGGLEKKQIAGTLQLNGKAAVDPNYKVSLSSALGGRIQNVNVLTGKYVKKGETLFTLEDNQFIQLQQDYLTTKAELLSAEPNYIRQKELNTNKSASDKVMQQAEADYRALLAVKSGLEQKLRLININPETLTPSSIKRSIAVSAPFNGLVSEVLVNKGKYVSPSDVLAELVNPQGLLLNIKVFEKDLPHIQVGQALQAYTNGNPDNKAEARIISKGGRVYEDGTAEVVARISNPKSLELLEGLYVNATINVENMEVYALPADAVVSFEGKNYIFEQVDKNKFRMAEVTLDENTGENTTIVNYQNFEGKVVVVKGAYNLLMALKNKSDE